MFEFSQLLPLLPGFMTSMFLFLASTAIGIPLGVAAGWGMHAGIAPLRIVITCLVEIGRGFPALVTLYIVYFGFPFIGVVLDAFVSLVVAFAFTTAAYTADIFRGAFAAIPRSQIEAADALALGPWSTFRVVVWPTAFRIALVPVLGFSIIIFQATSLAYSVGLRDIVSRAYDQGSVHANLMPYLLWAAVLYLATSALLMVTTWYVERRISGKSIPVARALMMRSVA